MKNPVTPRRCKRCGTIGHVPHEGGYCPRCTKLIEKNK